MISSTPGLAIFNKNPKKEIGPARPPAFPYEKKIVHFTELPFENGVKNTVNNNSGMDAAKRERLKLKCLGEAAMMNQQKEGPSDPAKSSTPLIPVPAKSSTPTSIPTAPSIPATLPAPTPSRKRTISNSSSTSTNGGGGENGAPPGTSYIRNIINAGWYGCDQVRGRRRGCGLHNPMNNCFLNSVLQALVHTAEFARLILDSSGDPRICVRSNHQKNNTTNSVFFNTDCLHCALKSHIIRVISSDAVYNPFWINRFLPKLFPHHRSGSQEDAHEMLTLLLGALEPLPPKQSSSLNGVVKQPRMSTIPGDNWTPIEEIFGGRLKNEIVCLHCETVHTNYEKIREINLGLGMNRQHQFDGRANLDDLLADFFKEEVFQNFQCKRCAEKVPARRHTTVVKLPAVLIIQLKRFNPMGGKNRLHVVTKPQLNFQRFLSQKTQIHNTTYRLNGLIEHLGGGLNFGHYVCAMRGFNGNDWFKFDDSDISLISENYTRTHMQPYILFYTRMQGRPLPQENRNQQQQQQYTTMNNGNGIKQNNFIRHNSSFGGGYKGNGKQQNYHPQQNGMNRRLNQTFSHFPTTSAGTPPNYARSRYGTNNTHY